MSVFSCWLNAISPDSSTFWAEYFFYRLEPDWTRTGHTSPWSKNETKDDWSTDQLKSNLAAIGLDVLSCGGYCPVQVEALLPSGHELYFRARDNSWYCEVEDLGLYHEGSYGQDMFAAGYMPLSEVFKRVRDSLNQWEVVA